MTQYKEGFKFETAFPPQSMDNVLAEWLGRKGVKQCHIAGKLLINLRNRKVCTCYFFL